MFGKFLNQACFPGAGDGRIMGDMGRFQPLYIFDLDGTLSLATHRLPLIDPSNGPKQWRAFYEACDKDEPNFPVIRLLGQLRTIGAAIWIFTGRSDIVREKTEQWLFTHTSLSLGELEVGLRMRKDGDFEPDDELKERWLKSLSEQDRQRLVMAFEDRDRVVGMWRRNGVTCLQVAAGQF